MDKEKQNKDIGITEKKENDISEWYSQVCLKGELADYGTVKGTMIIRPRGYFIWQTIQDYFNKKIVEKTNAKNAYFPLFIPESFFKKEAQHAKGFSPEVAWIDKSLTKDGERLAIRPTSETIMYDSYSKWIRSYKDLPLKINQWCNIVRWETQATKLFLRSREFLWQEGHCVYSTKTECKKETINYIKSYQKLCKDLLALPVIVGKKTEKEKFAGAETSYTIEAFMPDGKALQCGTSHELGQGFAKSFNIRFIDENEKSQVPWQNSWGLSTRLIGALVLTHSDDKGLILPPQISENKIVIIPIIKEDSKEKVMKKAKEIANELKSFNPVLDDRLDYSPGFKYNEWELKGIPIRIEIGPKDLEKSQVVLARRDLKEKKEIKLSILKKTIEKELEEMHSNLYNKAENFLKHSIVKADKLSDLIKHVKDKKIVLANFCGDIDCEDSLKEKTQGITTRCIPLDSINKTAKGNCIFCNKKAAYEVLFGRSY
ncbi:MAG TPA: proline--tRNA ligase [Candidatus Nanoarchaeia archaeon]|nr:proline--tRNA ligase [Candidatus Nanoarchaeia archaeon]